MKRGGVDINNAEIGLLPVLCVFVFSLVAELLRRNVEDGCLVRGTAIVIMRH